MVRSLMGNVDLQLNYYCPFSSYKKFTRVDWHKNGLLIYSVTSYCVAR